MLRYVSFRSRQLRAARIGGRRELTFLASWIDRWMLGDHTRELDGHVGMEQKNNSPLNPTDASDTGAGWP